MTKDEARAALLRLAEHMDTAKANCAKMGSGIGSLNQVAWLGEIAVGMGDTVRLALSES